MEQVNTPQPALSLSVLLIKEDYIQYSAQLRRQQRQGHVPLLTCGGALLCILGLAGVFFGSFISLAMPSALGLVLVGAFLLCYDGLFAPMLDRAAAARNFEEKPELHMAGTYVFTQDDVEIRTAGLEGRIPLNLVTRWNETPSLISLSFGREIQIILPKRLLKEEDLAFLNHLHTNLSV